MNLKKSLYLRSQIKDHRNLKYYKDEKDISAIQKEKGKQAWVQGKNVHS